MGTRKLANRWKVTHQRRGGPWTERPESKVKVYRYVQNELTNWLCGALPSPTMKIWVDERDGRGWQLYEKIDLEELAELERAENS